MDLLCRDSFLRLFLVIFVAEHAIKPSFSYPAEADAVVVSSSSKDIPDVNTKLFTGNEQEDNVLAAGAVGLGLGIGGVLLAQAILDKPDCRYRRFDMGGLFGNNKDCHKKYPSRPQRPTYPSRPQHHGGGGYREPGYDRPYRPSTPYKEPHRPYRPASSYQEPHEPYRPQRPYKEPYRPQRPYKEPHRPSSGYREPSYHVPSSYREPEPYRRPHQSNQYKEPPRYVETPYRKPKPQYQKPTVYSPPPTSSYREPSNAYYPQSGIRGRTAGDNPSKNNDDEVEGGGESNKEAVDQSKRTQKALNSGRVRFADK